jgi:hypothetical protein
MYIEWMFVTEFGKENPAQMERHREMERERERERERPMIS